MKVAWDAFIYDFKFTVLMNVTWDALFFFFFKFIVLMKVTKDAFACVLNA